MKFSTIVPLLLFTFLVACNNQTTKPFESIAPKEFAEKIKTTQNPQILDVRTADEFESEHLKNAVNLNWNGEDFDSKAEAYDKSKPVFVYCLSGGRSKKAATKLKELGFTTVYELDGGIMNWTGEVSGAPTTDTGMTINEFNDLLKTDKKVLIDFYAEWCGPCKQMEPFLLKLQKEMADKVTIIRIDVDKNKALATELKVDQLPTLILYKNKTTEWKTVGFVSEENLKKQLQ
ncbi:thioredoxin [Flavobacterium branchiicola]|uniref:Thioredoxin n=1 Tax=Flavobacterium branchiicola TaxID=1114875 RepID=A0ABV9PKH4_9FLAO|nr:thioredoxin [Flavobacterium branchiicola]MBS7255572.1 thioredoxin [Flavobacterium branchiicola]